MSTIENSKLIGAPTFPPAVDGAHDLDLSDGAALVLDQAEFGVRSWEPVTKATRGEVLAAAAIMILTVGFLAGLWLGMVLMETAVP